MTPLGLRSARGGPAISLAFSVRMAKPAMGRRCVIAAAAQSPPIMVNSCAGKMGLAAAEAVVRAGLELVPCTFTAAPVEEGDTIDVGGVAVDLVGLEQQQATIEKVKQDYPSLIMVDFTLPDAVNGNARWYIENGIPFVMGTTGGDRQQLLAEVSDSGLYAVIAPQMGKQIVAFQAMMQYMAENFPGAFSGYELEVVESHQKTKVDTSGTAKAIVSSFQGMGLDFDVDQIEKVRDAEQQMDRMGVPEAALDGHAFHTYSLKSADGSVTFQFQHNVCGRRIYAEGTVDAALFLAKQIQDGSEQRLFNMIDVLKGGAMR